MEVDRFGKAIIFEVLFDNLALIHVVAPRRIEVHFLEKDEVRIESVRRVASGFDIVLRGVLGARPGLFAAVHKAGVILLVRAETEILRNDGVARSRLDFRVRRCSRGSQREIIRDAGIVDQKIGEIANRNDNDD